MNIKDLSGRSKPIFMDEEQIKVALLAMEQDSGLDTKPVYVKDSPSDIRLVTFREKHLAYLKGHPKVNPEFYLSNLRTMIKIRS